MQLIENVIDALSGWIWGAPMLVALVGTGVYLTVILRGVQLRGFFLAFRLILRQEQHADGDISHFAALTTALAATVGIGNIVGVATAISLGGPGAVFWMWMTGLVGMATKYSEALLAVKFREKGPRGMRGGPMYYLAKGARLPRLAWLFALFTALATFGIGNMTQANSVAAALASAFGVPSWQSGVCMTFLTGLVILGGVRSIGKFTAVLVPLMIIGYVGASVLVLVENRHELVGAVKLIFREAFAPTAAEGGIAGAGLATAIRYGVARGVFSNESGLGSAPIAAAAARSRSPVEQALVSMTQTFIDTLLVCSMTALVILTGDSWKAGVGAANLTAASFADTLGVSGSLIVTLGITLFGYSTLIGWNYYGEKAVEYLAGVRAIVPYRIVFVSMIMVGAMTKLELVWSFSDLMNGLMALPNLVGLLVLSGVIRRETEAYFSATRLESARKRQVGTSASAPKKRRVDRRSQ